MFRIAPHLFNVTRYDGKRVAMGPSVCTTALLDVYITEDAVYFPSIRKGEMVLKGRLYKYSLLMRKLQGRMTIRFEYDEHGIMVGDRGAGKTTMLLDDDYLFLHQMGEWVPYSDMVADAL